MLTSSIVRRDDARGLFNFSTGGIPAGNRADKFLLMDPYLCCSWADPILDPDPLPDDSLSLSGELSLELISSVDPPPL